MKLRLFTDIRQLFLSVHLIPVHERGGGGGSGFRCPPHVFFFLGGGVPSPNTERHGPDFFSNLLEKNAALASQRLSDALCQ